MNGIRNLGYIGMGARDLEAWVTFGTDVLGLELIERQADATVLLRMDENHWRIAVHQSEREDALYLGFEVSGPDALAELERSVRAHGVDVRKGTPEQAKKRHVVDLISFNDPEGLLIEVFYGPRVRSDQPFRSARAMSGGFVTGQQGLGHVFLNARDYGRAMKFWCDVLGFRISDHVAIPIPGATGVMTFLHCSPRHHTVAIASFPIPMRVQHLMLQTQSVDDVGATFYLAQHKGASMAQSLGRHSNDEMLSFYVFAPNGVAIEYGWGAREVDENWHVQKHDAPSAWGHEPMGGMIEQMEKLRASSL